jgi:tetratricopeptide (TPR) repeat protein
MSTGRYTKGDVVNGKYEIHGVLGQGGFGIVYLIRMLDTGEAFAMKTFRDERMADATTQEAFTKEAMLWVNLERHPCIVAAQWVEQVSGRLFVLMEHIAADSKGRVSLADHLADPDGSLDMNQALEWGVQFCLGMEHAQSRGIKCHRDIKPGNILIAQGATLKISDFGLAMAAQSVWRGDSALNGGADVAFRFSVIETEGKMRCGTPGYMPPEVYRGEGADVRSDIYSFGLVLWQMVTRNPRPPFAAPWRGDAEAYLRGTYEQQMRERAPLVNGPIAGVINRCLHPKPQNRYGCFEELRGDLLPLYENCARRKFQIPSVGDKTAMFWNNKGGSLAALGRHDDATRCYDAALAIEPRAAQIWNNKGSALSALGRSEEATRCFDQALTIQPRFAMALDNKARQLMVGGRHQQALQCYDQVLTIDPHYAEAWQGKGIVFTKLERHEEAIRCYDRALALDGKLANAWHNRGLSLLGLQRDGEALECFDHALAINPRLLVALDRKAVALAGLERYAEAVQCFEQALALNPEDFDLWIILAQCRSAVGDIAGQMQALNKALERNPRDGMALICLAMALAKSGRNKEAMDHYHKANELGDLSIAKLIEQFRKLALREEDAFQRGYAFQQAGNYEEAIRCYDAGLAVDANHPDIWNNKGLALKALGKVREAIGCHERALAIDPQNTSAWGGKGNRSMDLEMHEQALACYNRVLAINPLDVNAWYAKGSASKALGRLDDAIACYDKALAIDPRMQVAWRDKAAAFCAQGRYKETLICYDKILEITPRDTRTWLLKGDSLGQLGSFQEALKCFLEAQKLGDPNAAKGIEQCRRLLAPDANRYFQLGSDYQQEGNNAEAIRCYEKGIAIDPSNVIIWCNLGAALLALNRGQEAVVCFDRAIALNPRDAGAWNNKGCALLAIGQQSEAYACLQEAKRLRT